MGLLILSLPLNWIGSAFLAALVHECSHLTALRIFHVPVFRLEIGAAGAVLETGSMTIREELLCALAGPAGSLSLLLVSEWIPRIALCGMVQGLFNLIPAGNLDGGRVLRCLIALLFGKKPCKQEKEGVQ